MNFFDQRGEMEDVFRLLQLAPASLHMSEADMLRLHHRATLYERRRVRHRRRWLYGYLLLQIVLVGAVFPWLFINAENGRFQQQVEDMTDVRGQYLSYADGLYWSLITAASIGYGDVTPKTGAGRAIAAIHGVMGVITVGVVAGLVIRWVTPRRLD